MATDLARALMQLDKLAVIGSHKPGFGSWADVHCRLWNAINKTIGVA
jgi:hypothetical protein